jgi:hypothetical protein
LPHTHLTLASQFRIDGARWGEVAAQVCAIEAGGGARGGLGIAGKRNVCGLVGAK